MSGRPARKKKLVRTRRVSDSDSSADRRGADGVGEVPREGQPPRGRGGREGGVSLMGDTARWQRAAVRAVQIQGGHHGLASATSWSGAASVADPPVNASPRAKLDVSFQESNARVINTKGTPFPFPGFVSNGGTRVNVSGGEGVRDGRGGEVGASEGDVSPTPPPAAWSDAPDANHVELRAPQDTDTESIPSSSHSSVLVDMGKVVGVLRTYPAQHELEPADGNGTAGEEGSDYSVTEEEDNVCATCTHEAARGDSEREDSLWGDPLVYATFVAPVQQYSTETEPSRQPSFNQNSSEAEPFPGPPPAETSSTYLAPSLPLAESLAQQDKVVDIYAAVPMEGWSAQPGPEVQEVSTAQLNHQVQQERLSFIHSQGSSEDHEYDQVPGSAAPPPLPLPRPSKLPGCGGGCGGWDDRVAQCHAGSQHTPLSTQEQWDEGERAEERGQGTVRRKGKRRAAGGEDARKGHATCNNVARRSKSRSKSRSPGREIERAIVIVHHTTCTHSRTTSPDNLSESSISFHENEVAFDLSPSSTGRGMPSAPAPWYSGGNMDPCVSVVREPGGGGEALPGSCRTAAATALQYSNWESCRESWFSSGSEPRPSSGSDCPPRPPSFGDSCDKAPPPSCLRGAEPLGGKSAPGTPRMARCVREGSEGRCASAASSTLPRSGVRHQSSRESSGSSCRGARATPTRPPTRSRSPGSQAVPSLPHRYQTGVGGSHSSLSGQPPRVPLHRPPPLSRDSTPSESGCSSGPSAPSASDQEVGCSDLAHHDSGTEEALIENLYHRFKRDQIYTWVSSVLVSINSYKKLSLYTPEVIDRYRSHCLRKLPPHIYALADRAWHNLRDRGEDQALVLTGESGAGKTEAGKLVLQYIAAVTGHAQEFQDIKYQLLQSNPVLEGFGNARTLHNENSSRFGKYIEVSFDFKGDTTGGAITNYWLEKTRVTHRADQERNFHIFYQLLAGADIHLLKELRLQRNVESYRLLHLQGGGSARPGHSSSHQQLTDRRDFHITRKALDDLGLSAAEICDIFKVVAAVLKLGNVNFVPMTNIDGTEGCRVENEYELYDIGELVSVQVDSLRSALLSRSVSAGSDSVVTDLSASEAETARDALCRTCYSRLFTLVVSRINEAIKVKTHRKHKVLAILDLYGFEAFLQNGFEQFIINFANEKLQQVFIEVVLKREQEEYLNEGVEFSQVGFFSNSVICHLVEQSSVGLLSLLDEVSMHFSGSSTPTCSDAAFLAAASTSLSSHPHFEAQNSSGKPGANPVPAHSFRIKHYAGSVTYSVDGFLSKNTDLLDRDLSNAMFQSGHPLLKTLFPEGNLRRNVRRRPATVGTQFKISIGALINNLGAKTPHFVRCIKPNENRLSRVFDMTLVQHQIRYLGLVELARLRRNGFAFRDQYGAFLQRFKMICSRTWPSWNGPAVEGVTFLLRELPISAKEYSFGRSKIFIRSLGVVDQLEEWRRDRLEELATLIQKIWRGWHARQNWNKLRDSQIVISTYWKRWKDKSHITELKQRRKQEWAVVILQKHYRRWQVWRWLLSLAHSLPSESPACRDWPRTPPAVKETSFLLRKLYHKWRCDRFRVRFDQTSRNRMREKVTASLIFKDRKSSYPRSICHPFLGDYVRLRQNPQWKKICGNTNDQYVVFADIINKITRTSGKFVPILFVISTSSMLILDQRTMQIKYRVPAGEIFKLSLSPYFDDIAVFHVRAGSPTRDLRSQANIPGCLSSDGMKKKGDFVFQTGHVIEIVTKLFLVVQNATGKPPAVNINTQFDANFGTHSVTFQFKTGNQAGQEVTPGHVKLVKRGNKMEVLL